MTAILIVEDEERIASFLAKGLRSAGFAPFRVALGTDAIAQAADPAFGLIVLDLGLPDIDGFEVLGQIRRRGVSTPVIVLTARDSPDDTVAGLRSGADDYMTKPFRFDELLARVHLRLRSQSERPSVLSYGDFSLDLVARRAHVAGRVVELTAREFALAEVFLRHPDHVLSREQLLAQVWGYDFDPGSNIVDVYVRYLRVKLGAGRLQTVRGMGYRLQPHGDKAPRAGMRTAGSRA